MEVKKLLSLHTDVRRYDRKLVSNFYPGIGKYSTRRIEVTIDMYYPECAPVAYVSPYRDIAGDVTKTDIYSDGEICYVEESDWDPRIHNLSFVFSQSKLIVFKAIMIREGYSWKKSQFILGRTSC